MVTPVHIKEERVSTPLPTMLPDPAALMCRKLLSRASMTLSNLLEGSDAERAENIQLYTLQLSKCHQSELFDLDLDSSVFSTLLRSASTPLQVKVCELMNTYIKAVKVEYEIVDNEEGIKSSGDLFSFYSRIHPDVVRYALPNVKAGEHCALFICNLISICSSRRIFMNIVNLFGRSISALLPQEDRKSTTVELSSECARQVIGIMKTLLHISKAFGSPPAPSMGLCDIASTVISATKAHLCRLYSYNLIAFLLRKSNKEEISQLLPKLSPAQVKQVMTLLKEANHLKDSYDWTFQYKATSPSEKFATPMKPNFSNSNFNAATKRVSSAKKDANQSEKIVFTHPAIENHRSFEKNIALSTASKSQITSDDTRTNAETRELVDEAARPTSSSISAFRSEWVKRLNSQFVDSHHDSKTHEYDREAWKPKSEVLSNIVDQVQRVKGKLTLGQNTVPLIAILENIFKLESAMPVIINGLKLLAMLLDKSQENLARNAKALNLIELVYERLKDGNNKVQSIAVTCVAWIITRSEESINVDLIKKALSHKSPLARIAMCNIIGGSLHVPVGACDIAGKLQVVKQQLVPVIKSLLEDKNVHVRKAALEANRALDDPSSVNIQVDPVIANFASTSDSIRAPVRKAVLDVKKQSDLRSRPKEANKVKNVASIGEASVDTIILVNGETIPKKRKLVRRFLKRLTHKQRKPGYDGKLDSAVAVNLIVTDASNDSQTNMQRVYTSDDHPISATTTSIKPAASLGGPKAMIEEHIQPTQCNGNELPSDLPFTQDQEKHTDTAPASDVPVSLAQAEADMAKYNGPQSSAEKYHSSQMLQEKMVEYSASELALRTYIPESMLNKVAKRGSSSRGLPEGLYELWKWISEDSEVAKSCEMHILHFVSECTNKFREPSKTGKTALYTFLEDFTEQGVTLEAAIFLTVRLSSEASNPKVFSILKKVMLCCDANAFIQNLLRCDTSNDSVEVSLEHLELINQAVSTNGVETLLETTLDTLRTCCSRFYKGNNGSSEVAKKLVTLLNTNEGSVLQAEQNQGQQIELQPMEENYICNPGSNVTVPSTQGETPVTAVTPTDIPYRIQRALENASSLLKLSVSQDLHTCMFREDSQDDLNRACVFWDMYIQQSKDTSGDLLFGEGNVRSHLLVWLCHTLLLGVADEVVMRSIENLFYKLKEVKMKLTQDEALIVMDMLSVLNVHNEKGGKVVSLFDGMLPVIDVTRSLLEQCPLGSTWKNMLKEVEVQTERCIEEAKARYETFISLPLSSSPKGSAKETSAVTSDGNHPVSPSTGEMVTPKQDIDEHEIRSQESLLLPVTDGDNYETVPVVTLGNSDSYHDCKQKTPSPKAVRQMKNSSLQKETNDAESDSSSISCFNPSAIPQPVQRISPFIEESPRMETERCDFATSPIHHPYAGSHSGFLPVEGTSTKHSGLNRESQASCVSDNFPIQLAALSVADTAEANDRHVPDLEMLETTRVETVDVGTSPDDMHGSGNGTTPANINESVDAEDEVTTFTNSEKHIATMKGNFTVEPIISCEDNERTEVGIDASRYEIIKRAEVMEIGIQTSPTVKEAVDPFIPEKNILGIGAYCSPDVKFPEGIIDARRDKEASYARSVAAESARSSISRILSEHLHIASRKAGESSDLMERYMKLVESVLSDCSYIANFCLLSDYQDYRPFLPSIHDEGMVESCIEKTQRILENLTMFPHQDHITLALSPVLLDSCHVSILRLCNEIENCAQDSKQFEKFIEAIVCLIELFTIASVQLDGRSLLLYCAVVIHCLALPKHCFHRNIKLYNGLSRLISVNALEQNADVLARLLVICLELSSQALRRRDGGRILLAMLRLNKILQSQITIHIQESTNISAVACEELRNSHLTFLSLLREYLRGSTCKSTLEPRLKDAIQHSNVLLNSMRDIL